MVTSVVYITSAHDEALQIVKAFKYANKIGADFFKVKPENFHEIQWRLKDRSIVLSGDVVITDNCPNLFDFVPKNKLGVFPVSKFPFPEVEKKIQKFASSLSEGDLRKWKGGYYDSCVMVLSRFHRSIFAGAVPDLLPDNFCAFVNKLVLQKNFEIEEISYKFNRLPYMDWLTGESRLKSFVINYTNAVAPEKLQNVIFEDIKLIERGEIPKQKFVIEVGGGIGDQVCAEPVIRKMIKMNKDSEFIVLTHFPGIFSHLPDVDAREYSNAGRTKPPYCPISLMPQKSHPMWSVCAHSMIHPVDWCSLLGLKRCLTDEDKTITLGSTKEGEEEVKSLNVKEHINKMILIHPGLGWESKTFPKYWWDAVIKGLSSKDIPIGVIGKRIDDYQGYVDVEITNGVTDFRDVLSLHGLFYLISKAPVLVSNDSAPIHIAGAFDNWIVLLPSCKHPDLVLPYRRGSKSYKTKALYKKLTYEALDTRPTNPDAESIDKVVGSIKEYIPNPEQVIEHVFKIYRGINVNH